MPSWPTLVAPLAVPVWWMLPPTLRRPFLAVVSFSLLSLYAPVAVGALTAIAGIVFWLAPSPERERPAGFGWILIALTVAPMAVFKVRAGVEGAEGLLVPLGLSYFTFKLVHYIIERGRGSIEDRSLSSFACWILMFPTFIAGPIERFDHFTSHADDRLTSDALQHGLLRIGHGLVKKFLVADFLIGEVLHLPTAQDLVGGLDSLPTQTIWAFLLGRFLSGYFDFAGYSDMAIGASRLFGIRIQENFDWPLLATSPGDFWRRWHRTLSQWCLTYVYFPVLGTTRRPYLAAYASFLIMGLWHAASPGWIAWGLYHGTVIALYQLWSKLNRGRELSIGERWAGRGFTLAYVTLAQSLTSFESQGGLTDGLRVALAAFGFTP